MSSYKLIELLSGKVSTIDGNLLMIYRYRYIHHLNKWQKAKYAMTPPFDQSSRPAILMIEEYVPRQAITSPRTAMQMQAVICNLFNLSPSMLR